MKIDRAEYVALCRTRWDSWCLTDARHNFADFEDIKSQLVDALTAFRRDPWQKDLNDRCLNPDGTLTAFLWKLQESLQPDKSCLHPLLDFNESSQTVFLRRGLLIYCQFVLRELETVELPAQDETMMLPI